MSYDYCLVGAGLFNAVLAYRLIEKGKKVLILEKRNHIGGNCYTYNLDGINVHKYGAHIFHTNNEYVWGFVNRFAKFNNFINSPVANYKGTIYNLPFNMNTFTKIWNVSTPREVQEIIKQQSAEITHEPKNLEEKAISLVGKDVYNILIKGYTEKQWGKSCKDLSPDIITRLPVRLMYDNNYFDSKYQGVAIGGYTSMIKSMIRGVDVQLSVDFTKNQKVDAKKIVYTGSVDKLFDYCYGTLEYRSLEFKTEVMNIENYQGNAVVNYTGDEPFTRKIEHKFFEKTKSPVTVVTTEYPIKWDVSKEPYYCVNNEKNNKLYKKYKDLAESRGIMLGGRLGLYKYLDMDKTVELALNYEL